MEEFQLQITQQNGENTVNARELWESLKVDTKFSMWIERRLSESLAVEKLILLVPKIGNGIINYLRGKNIILRLTKPLKSVC